MTQEPERAPRSYVVKTRVRDPELRRAGTARILEAATELFYENGFHATPVADIAEQAGFTIGAMYKYIRSKHDILYLLTESLASATEDLLAGWAALGRRPQAAIAGALDAYYRMCAERRKMYVISYRDIHHLDPRALRDALEMEYRMRSALVRVIHPAADEDGAQDDPTIRTIANNAILIGHMWAVNNRPYGHYLDLEEFIEIQTRLLMTQVRAWERARSRNGKANGPAVAPVRRR
jgi:AcrR family transcriptional regulator